MNASTNAYEKMRCRQASRATEQPLNPQQREVARTLLDYAYHYHSLKETLTLTGEQIVAKAKEKELTQITKVMGAAGVGKSQMIQATKKALENAGLGVAVVTANTGVAAGPFAGPTLLALLNMSPAQRQQNLRKDAPAMMARMRTKFEQECGIPPERVAVLIIDEISFVDVNTLGHVSHNFSLLLETQLKDGDKRTLCGGLPIMLCGDNHQIPAPKVTPWFATLVEAAHDRSLRQRSESGSPRPQGLAMLRQARLVSLVRQMRAIEDPDFVRDQNEMRSTSELQPVRKEFLDSIKVISRKDVEDDNNWLFTLVGVRGHWEGDAINQAQLRHFAEVYSLPIVKSKWRLTIQKRGQVKALLQGVILEELYENEPNAWAYFVQGAPILISDNLRSTRKLVNGTPGLLYSLNIDDEIEKAKVDHAHVEAKRFGFDGEYVILSKPPVSVNTIVGGTKENPRLWHGVPLEDLHELLADTVNDSSHNHSAEYEEDADERMIEQEQVIPLMQTRNDQDVRVHSSVARARGIPYKLITRQHPYQLAFALTDFKLQGKTLNKLIISAPPRDEPPHFKLSTLLVFTTRVHKRSQLRWLQRDARAMKQLTQLRQSKSLALWSHSYDANTRRWSDALARDNTILYEDVYESKVSLRHPGGIRTQAHRAKHQAEDGSLALEAPHLRTVEAVQWQKALQARKRQKKNVPVPQVEVK